jgi:hypothetical protein
MHRESYGATLVIKYSLHIALWKYNRQLHGFCNKWHKGSRQVFVRACSLPKCLFTLLCCDLFILLLCCTVVLMYIGFVGICTQLKLIKKLTLANTDIS